jgi:hypothetical protein
VPRNNKELERQYLKKYRQTSKYKKYHDAYMKQYREDHKEELAQKSNKRHKEWRDETRDSFLHIRRDLLRRAKKRAAYQETPFNLTLDDIEVPKYCPVLGIELKPNKGRFSDGSPSLDKFIPKKGYTRGNVYVISHRANVLKGNAAVQEVAAILRWMRRITQQRRR